MVFARITRKHTPKDRSHRLVASIYIIAIVFIQDIYLII